MKTGPSHCDSATCANTEPCLCVCAGCVLAMTLDAGGVAD